MFWISPFFSHHPKKFSGSLAFYMFLNIHSMAKWLIRCDNFHPLRSMVGRVKHLATMDLSVNPSLSENSLNKGINAWSCCPIVSCSSRGTCKWPWCPSTWTCGSRPSRISYPEPGTLLQQMFLQVSGWCWVRLFGVRRMLVGNGKNQRIWSAKKFCQNRGKSSKEWP